jgi:hypothetical protein
MSTSIDDRDLLEVLKFELDFVDQGGYGRSVRTPWKKTSTFQGSLSCINFGDPERTHPCNQCQLMQFVPPGARSEDVPCHHIPLDETGRTVDTIEQKGNQEEIEESVKKWLRTTIQRLEQERSGALTSGG